MLTLLFASLLATPAWAHRTVPFECCHLPTPLQATASPKTIRLTPPDDQRPLNASPEDAPRQVGVVRGGYANTFKLIAEDTVTSMVQTAFTKRLEQLGHTVVTGDAEADLVVTTVIRDFEVDISSYGTYKQRAKIDVKLEGAGAAVVASLEFNEHNTSGGRLGMARGLKQQANAWYGRGGIRYASTAAVELLLIGLATQLGEPNHPSSNQLLSSAP